MSDLVLEDFSISELLFYMPILIDYDEIDDFILSFKDKLDQEDYNKLIKDLDDVKYGAWMDHFHSSKFSYFKGNINGFDFDIGFEFRLRTLCVNIKSWWYSNDEINILSATEYINGIEEEFKKLKDKWSKYSVINKIYVIKPFYNKLDDNILNKEKELFNLFPIDCPIHYSFTISSSKLLEQVEDVPFIVGNIRDNRGVLINTLILCNEKDRTDELPCSYGRTRWVYFSNLIRHVIGRINQQLMSIKNSLPHLEIEIHNNINVITNSDSIKHSLETIEKIVDINNKIASHEEQLSLMRDSILGVNDNIKIIRRTAGTSGVTKELVLDNLLYGNTHTLNEIKSGTGRGIMGSSNFDADKIECSFNNNCLLCTKKRSLKKIPSDPPFEYGAVGEVYVQIKSAMGIYRKEMRDTTKTIKRIKNYFSNTLETIMLETNLNLTNSLLETTSNQTKLLTQMEKVITESETTRKISQKNSRVVELISLVFASFVVGEISSNFIIGWLQQNSTQYPFHIYLSGFAITLVISVFAFIVLYFGYLK